MFNSFFPQLWLFYLFILIFLRTFAPNKIKTFMNSKKRYMVIALLALLVVSAMEVWLRFQTGYSCRSDGYEECRYGWYLADAGT